MQEFDDIALLQEYVKHAFEEDFEALKSAAVRDADQIFAWVMKQAVRGNVNKSIKAATI